MTTFLAIWGSILSTLLVVLKIRETCSDRFRLSTSLGLNSGGPNTNVVSITNHYKNLITIDGLELFWATKLKDESTHKNVPIGYEEECNIVIPAHSTTKLVFEEINYFTIRPEAGDLYIRLHIPGKGRVIQKLY